MLGGQQSLEVAGSQPGPAVLHLVLELCVHMSVCAVSTISVTWSYGSSLPPCGQIPIVAPAFLADDSLLGVAVSSEWM